MFTRITCSPCLWDPSHPFGPDPWSPIQIILVGLACSWAVTQPWLSQFAEPIFRQVASSSALLIPLLLTFHTLGVDYI